MNDPSPPSSSASDSDAFNTESARLYFGPVKTPERNFVASNKQLHPPAISPFLRRSPRLSTLRVQPPPALSTTGEEPQETSAQEAEDIDLVARLVNEVEVDDEGESSYDSLFGTPPKGFAELEPDEPLSALADKILHAVGNPSPPPTPPTALRMFDPYHTTNAKISEDYLDDLISLNMLDEPAITDDGPLRRTRESIQLHSSMMSDSSSSKSINLITFDSPYLAEPPNSTSRQAMSVEDMLSQSPGSSLPSLATGEIIMAEGTDMSIDFPNAMVPERPLLANNLVPEIQEQDIPGVHPDVNTVPVVAEKPMSTPLRRSSRPRKSLLPNISPQPPVFTVPLSAARTSIRKKQAFRNPDGEIVSDSQDEDGDIRQSPSRALPSTPQNRHRSPDKEPLSFHRQLGSLSPTSANVLSTLAFNINDDAKLTADSSSVTHTTFKPPAMSSFSVFATLTEATGGPSTPVRPDGAKRVLGSPKAESSPNKFRLQTPALDNPSNTPARRIPIEQAVAQGQLSPGKAAQMGFKSTGTPSVFVPTPARRVLVQAHPRSTIKSNGLRLDASIKSKTQRDRFVPSVSQVIPSLKGKEKAISPTPEESVIKPGNLPFPIDTRASNSSESRAQNNSTKSVSSPTKSTLKQTTSKIPRINTKPYARKVNVKTSERAARVVTIRPVDPIKPSTPSENTTKAKRTIRPVEAVKSNSHSVTHTRPMVSPSKPRTTVLRQVPLLPARSRQLTDTPTQPKSVTTSASAMGVKQGRDTVYIRRVVSPKPPSPPPEQPLLEPACEDTIMEDPQPLESTLPLGLSSPVPITCDLPPGSPMIQDPCHLEQQPESIEPHPTLPTPNPSIIVSEPATPPSANEPISSGLRRTTRSRRTADPASKVRSRPSTRRKATPCQFDDVFSGMSITALKELTSSNTEKNQHYLAAKLETEVVRKEGARPESPAVKIRTVVQRQQEEKERERGERAKRRAKRNGNNETTLMSDVEASSEAGFSSSCDDQTEDVEDVAIFNADGLLKHRRGAGDEEDYVTPEKPLRNSQARRIDDRSGDNNDKTVNWDRGLFTFVYLDEVKLGTRQTFKENRTLKGILTPAAKALRLDTLGNLLHADTPLTDLVPENVTVKKFVYENDDVPAPEPPVVKPRRSRSKRK